MELVFLQSGSIYNTGLNNNNLQNQEIGEVFVVSFFGSDFLEAFHSRPSSIPTQKEFLNFLKVLEIIFKILPIVVYLSRIFLMNSPCSDFLKSSRIANLLSVNCMNNLLSCILCIINLPCMMSVNLLVPLVSSKNNFSCVDDYNMVTHIN